jgi:hypothetical protein
LRSINALELSGGAISTFFSVPLALTPASLPHNGDCGNLANGSISLTGLREKLVKIGVKVVSHGVT